MFFLQKPWNQLATLLTTLFYFITNQLMLRDLFPGNSVHTILTRTAHFDFWAFPEMRFLMLQTCLFAA